MLATYHFMNEGLEALTGRRIGFDPIHYIREYIEGEYEDEDHPLRTMGANMAGNVVSNLPFGSYGAAALQLTTGDSNFTSKLFGEEDPSRFGVGGVLLDTVGEPVGQAVSGQNINLLKPILSMTAPYGGRQIERSVRGLQDMGKIPKVNVNLEDGVSVENRDFPASYTNKGNLRFPIEDTAGNLVKSLAFGSFATPEGKDYLARGYKPLSDKQTTTVEEAYRNSYIANNLPIEATVAALHRKGEADKDGDGNGGVKDSELSAYVSKIAKEYGLSAEQQRLLWRIVSGKA
jgi:hypothetical protein